MRAIPTVLASLGAAFLAAQPAAAKEKEPIVYTPTGPWVFDYADDHCAFRRYFEAEGDRFFVEFRQYTPGLSFDLIAMSDNLRAERDEFSFRFAPFEAVITPETQYPMSSSEGGKGQFGSGKFSPLSESEADEGKSKDLHVLEHLGWLQTIEALELVSGFKKPVRLETGPFADLHTLSNHCLNKLVEEWGLDPERLAKAARAVSPRNMEVWQKKVADGYPLKALRRGKVGATRLRLMIDEQGRITSCTSLAQVADTSLSDRACEEMMDHAEFEPALDETGAPMPSFYVFNVSFKIG